MPFNTINDKTMSIPRLYINIAEQLWPAYQVCGYTGLALALLVTVVLAVKLNLSTWILLGISGGGIITFLSLAMVTKIIIGRESLIYYHHEIAILLATAGFIQFLHQPVLPYLDITLLGIGTFLFCGDMDMQTLSTSKFNCIADKILKDLQQFRFDSQDHRKR